LFHGGTNSDALQVGLVPLNDLPDSLRFGETEVLPELASRMRPMSDPPEIRTTSTPQPSQRSLFATVLATFKQACDLPDIEVATALLRVLETMTSTRFVGHEADRLRAEHRIVAARARLRKLEGRGSDRKRVRPM
jgi:hypothetical protein